MRRSGWEISHTVRMESDGEDGDGVILANENERIQSTE